MLILVDQDGPLADWEAGLVAAWRTTHPHIPHVPVEERRGWAIEHQYPEEHRGLISDLSAEVGFYRNLPLVAGAKQALGELVADGHDVRICTSPAIRFSNCVAEKFHWVEDHLGVEWVRRIIIAADKTWIRGDVLIDDKPEITGTLAPVWRHVIFTTHANADSPGTHLTWGRHREVLEQIAVSRGTPTAR